MGDVHWSKLRDESFNDFLRKRESEKKKLKPLTKNQEVYFDAMDNMKATVCIGPAGTGKSFCAAGKALEMFKAGKVERIVLTRPLQECGEQMGFLPGDLYEKVVDMMMPLIEALEEFLAPGEFDRLREQEKIVIIPLEKMRGRTLKNAFVILDEAQNATLRQLKMFVTRFGDKCKMVVCGDHTQSDLTYQGVNSLAEAVARFQSEPHEKVAVVQLTEEDIVRDELVRWFDRVLSKKIPESYPKSSFEMTPCPGCGISMWYDRAADASDRLIRCPGCKEYVELRDSTGKFDPGVIIKPNKKDIEASYPGLLNQP